MPRDGTAISRRNVLKAAGGAIAATGLASARPGDRVEVNVGFDADSGRRAAVSQASSVVREFDSIDVVTLELPKQAADALSARADVRYVEQNGTMHAHAQTLPYGIDRVDAEVAHANGDTGSGADVAIIDTGIDSDHPDLQANLGAGTAFVDCSGSCNETWDDDNQHGTHVAGIADADDNTEAVVGVSTEATLHAVKVLDGNGSGTFADVASGIEFVANQGWDVANLSLGASTGSQAVTDAAQFAESEGVLLVASAGNSGPCSECVGFPARLPEMVAVSSTDSDDNLSSFSSTGSEVELAAPGSNILSTVPGGTGTLSGTSMSAPHVSGAGGQLMATGMSNTQARQTLADTAEDIGLGSNEQGAGLLDVAAALGHDSSDDLGGGGGGGGGGDNAPTVDTFSVSNSSNPAWARFDVSWAVSDADGDLSSVDLALTQNGSTVDSASVSVSGSSASGSTRLETRGSGSFDITITVTDGNGNTASSTTTVTA